jgi:cytidylate kinase
MNVVALYGPSCSGKTSVAQALAPPLDASLRSCGELVREYARQIGVHVMELADDDHRAIDRETRLIAEDATGLWVIDGSFLDHVLGGLQNVSLIRLSASKEERQRRQSNRNITTPIAVRDAADDETRVRLYGRAPRLAPDHDIDTTAFTVSEVVTKIENLLGFT